MQLTRDLPQISAPTLALRFVRLALGGALRRCARALGSKRPKPLNLNDLPVPDSAIAKKATALARGCEPDYLFHHSVRTYLFGLAIGEHLELKPDRELLYLASVLHDLALVPEHDGPGSFELRSAQIAHDFLVSERMSSTRADLVHEAIALHTSAGIAHAREPEVALTHLGAGLDVIGVHAEDVAPATREAIVQAWPRAYFKRAFSALLEDQAVRKPQCHIAGHLKLGFTRKINGAPFHE